MSGLLSLKDFLINPKLRQDKSKKQAHKIQVDRRVINKDWCLLWLHFEVIQRPRTPSVSKRRRKARVSIGIARNRTPQPGYHIKIMTNKSSFMAHNGFACSCEISICNQHQQQQQPCKKRNCSFKPRLRPLLKRSHFLHTFHRF